VQRWRSEPSISSGEEADGESEGLVVGAVGGLGLEEVAMQRTVRREVMIERTGRLSETFEKLCCFICSDMASASGEGTEVAALEWMGADHDLADKDSTRYIAKRENRATRQLHPTTMVSARQKQRTFS
jgi:hypothetical protein